MNKEEALKIINDVFIDVLDNKNIIINLNTTANDVEDWDSLNHIYLVVAIEKRFGKKFTAKQIQQWSCVGDVLKDLNN